LGTIKYQRRVGDKNARHTTIVKRMMMNRYRLFMPSLQMKTFPGIQDAGKRRVYHSSVYLICGLAALIFNLVRLLFFRPVFLPGGHGGNGAAAEFNLGSLINLNNDGTFLNALDNPVDAPDGYDPVPFFKGLKHTLGVLLLLVLRTYNKKVKDTDYQHKGEKGHNIAGKTAA
jgi:hypothetical protein